MYRTQMTEQESSVLRWGGLAGIAGSLVLGATFVIVAALVGADHVAAAAHEAVVRFPDIRSARVAENGLYLAALVLWVVHLLALNRALRDSSRASVTFGSALGVLGLAIMAAGALLHVAFDPIADLYHAAGTTPQDQATLVLLWQATQGTLDALFVAGLVIVPPALIALGAAMLRAPAFGRGLGKLTVGLGLFGALAAVVLLIDPDHAIAVGVVFALIIFNLAVGWRTYTLSRIPGSAPIGDRVISTSTR